MDSRLTFLRRLVERWRDGIRIAIRQLETSVGQTETAGLENPPASVKV